MEAPTVKSKEEVFLRVLAALSFISGIIFGIVSFFVDGETGDHFQYYAAFFVFAGFIIDVNADTVAIKKKIGLK